MSAINNITKKKERCKNGERWNPKTQQCEKISDIKLAANKRRKTKYSETKIKNVSVNPITIGEPMQSPFLERELGVIENEPEPVLTIIEENPVLEMEPETPVVEKPVLEMEPLPPVVETPVLETSSPDIITPIVKNGKTRKCPNGYNINHSTGKCHKTKKRIPSPTKQSIELNIPVDTLPEQIVENIEVPQEEPIEDMDIPTNTETVIEEPLNEEPVNEELVNEEPDIIPITENTSSEYGKNRYLQEMEKYEYDLESSSPDTSYDFLYPHLNDPLFNVKIAKRKEFADTTYDGTIYDIKKQADILCSADFELMPHQLFVKNFMSFQTPYNSLLLYHGLGSGKTCSAIGIAEEMRAYMKQMGIKKPILVIASPNVQSNFRLQLFDEKKLKKIPNPNKSAGSSNDIWNINSCIGNSLLKEINPTQLKGLPREKVISQINSIINQSYIFMGYGQLVNFITEKISLNNENGNYTEKEISNFEIKSIQNHFNSRLIIVDEVHNIRITDENNNKKAAVLLMKLAKHAENMRLLFLSATPMYNSYKEIIWIINLMNLNDKRSTIEISDVFDSNGEFIKGQKTDKKTIEDGKDLLKRKLTGYISYIRGETPYVFPYRLYPKLFSIQDTFDNPANVYPTIQMNGNGLDEKINHVNVYLNYCGDYQEKAYNMMIDYMRRKSYSYYTKTGKKRDLPSFDNMESFGYTMLQGPLEALNIVYPNPSLDKLLLDYSENPEEIEIKMSSTEGSVEYPFVGSTGLSSIVKYKEKTSPILLREHFTYKPDVLKKYGPIFSPNNIKKYSKKISNICNCILNSTGIVIIYSQYIDGGVIPMALALEEMGFTRWSSTNTHNKSLFASRREGSELIDAITMKTKTESFGDDTPFHPAKYIMITGDKSISPSNAADISIATQPDNRRGEQVKVIIISKAGSEGLDFKNIRQIHILEPWYNMNRIEQIIGRGVRNLSHCMLPFEERNVELYLHATLLKNKEEAADLYVYRFAEKKAVQIGRVTRVLKESSVDCILNIGQTNLTTQKLLSVAENKNIKIKTSNGNELDYKIGDESFTNICDYMENCEYTCSPNATIGKDDIINENYNVDFVKMNINTIISKIKNLYREPNRTFYKRDVLIHSINIIKQYPIEQIYYALTYLIQNKNEYLYDYYGRSGNLINKNEYYIFQPIEITDTNASIYERSSPVDYKQDAIYLEIQQEFKKEKEAVPSKKADIHMEDNEKGDESIQQAELVNAEVILQKIFENSEIVFSDTPSIIKSGEKNWYKHANHVMGHIQMEYGISLDYLKTYVVEHILDLMMFENKMTLFTFIKTIDIQRYTKDYEINIINDIQSYFAERTMKIGSKECLLLIKENSWKMFINEPENEDEEIPVNSYDWKDAEPEDYKLFESLLSKFIIDPKKMNTNIIGFVNMFKNKDMVFKIKDVRQKRNNIGARCGDSTTKGDVIGLLNILLDNTYYSGTLILHYGLCVIIEMLLRYKNKTTNHKYFFNPEETSINNIAKL